MTLPTVSREATDPQRIEPDRKAYLVCKAYDNNTSKWLKTGVWSQVSGDPVTLTAATTSETYPVGYASFTAPRATVTKDYVFRLTVTAASGETASATHTVTVPPYQGV